MNEIQLVILTFIFLMLGMLSHILGVLTGETFWKIISFVWYSVVLVVSAVRFYDFAVQTWLM